MSERTDAARSAWEDKYLRQKKRAERAERVVEFARIFYESFSDHVHQERCQKCAEAWVNLGNSLVENEL